jgi:hypothetical protein
MHGLGINMAQQDVKTPFQKRLLIATDLWFKLQERPLKNRQIMLNAWQSGYFLDNNTGKKASPHPINLIERGLSILIPYLVMTNPQITISSFIKEYRPYAKITELAFTHLFKKIKFAKATLRPLVRDALLGLGIVKTGIMKSHEVELFGYTHDVGQVYSDVVDMSDYIGDVTATSFEGFELEGNRYRMPLAVAKALFPKHADSLKSSFVLHGEKDKNRPERITKSGILDGMYDSLREMVELYDYWIPDEEVILTVDPRSEKILAEREYDGPEGGPYDKLYFKDFPGSVIPIPPVWHWLDLDTIINIIINKMRIQAESQKVNMAYEGDAADDADRLASAGDREAVKVSNVEGIKQIEWPGIDPNYYNWINYLEGQYSLQGMNLYTLGGRASGAETLGQEQMLMANSSKAVDDMFTQVYDTTASIGHKVAWHWWNDPLVQVPMIRRLEGYGEIDVVYDKTSRKGDFWDFGFDIEPYSMHRLNPAIAYQRMLGLLGQWILPSAQIGAQQGAVINVPGATKKLAKLAGVKELDDIYESGEPSKVGLNPYQPQPGKVKNNDVADGRTGINPESSEANSRQKLASDGRSL